MYVLPKDMWLVRLRDNKEKVITVKCPNCANWSYLDHEVHGNGEVTPSLICDWDIPEMGGKCNFHEFITLQGWNPKLMEV